MANIKQINIQGTIYDLKDAESVSFVQQELTEEQKMQARENIDAINLDDTKITSVKTGESIIINDVSPVEHNMNVSVINKNLFYQKGSISFGNLGLTATYDEETDTFTINGTQTSAGNITLSNGIEIPNGTYTITILPVSGSITYVSGGNSLLSVFAKGTSDTFISPRVGINSSNYNSNISATGSPNKVDKWNGQGIVYLQTYGVGNVFDNYTFKIQIESGTSATEYVKHIDLESVSLTVSDGTIFEYYTPLSDGTVHKVKSFYPNMTLTTDVEGLIINCEYLNTRYEVLENEHIKEIAKDAETLSGAVLSTTLNDSDAEIPTSKAIFDELKNKSDSGHSHNNYIPTTRTINGKILNENIILSASDVGALPNTTEIPNALADLTADSSHRTVTDAEKESWNAKSDFSGSYNDLIDKPSIPSISGLATEIYVDNVVSTKVDKVSGKGLSTNDYTTTEKNKLSGIATGAEVNQNAFSNVVVDSTIISADSETDSLIITAGTGIAVAGDMTNNEVIITNSGVRSISTGGTNGAISVNTNGTSEDVFIKGLGSAAYTESTAYDSAGTAKIKADEALDSAKTYADGIKNDLLNGAGEAYDTLKELGDLIKENVDAIDALEIVASGKANAVHAHGNITNDGAIGTDENKGIYTTTNGVLIAGTIPVSAGGTGNTSVDTTPTSGSTKMVTSGGLYTALAAKAAKASPTFTGTPKAPTAAAGTNTTQIATTAFVQTALSNAGGINIVTSATQPTGQSTGDFWYKILQ